MTNYREILRQYSLGLNKSQIAAVCGYAGNTVAQTISLAEENGLNLNIYHFVNPKSYCK